MITRADPKDSPNKDEVRSEALTLITDYISRYRNRGMVNKTQSFTTMQTALNAMAGHYKNFASRPLPDKLKERLTKEFSLSLRMKLVTFTSSSMEVSNPSTNNPVRVFW